MWGMDSLLFHKLDALMMPGHWQQLCSLNPAQRCRPAPSRPAPTPVPAPVEWEATGVWRQTASTAMISTHPNCVLPAWLVQSAVSLQPGSFHEEGEQVCLAAVCLLNKGWLMPSRLQPWVWIEVLSRRRHMFTVLTWKSYPNNLKATATLFSVGQIDTWSFTFFLFFHIEV